MHEVSIRISENELFIILAALAPYRDDVLYKKVFDKISSRLIDNFFEGKDIISGNFNLPPSSINCSS